MYLSLPQSLRREQTFASLALLPKRTRKAHKKTSNVSKIRGALNNDGSKPNTRKTRKNDVRLEVKSPTLPVVGDGRQHVTHVSASRR